MESGWPLDDGDGATIPLFATEWTGYAIALALSGLGCCCLTFCTYTIEEKKKIEASGMAAVLPAAMCCAVPTTLCASLIILIIALTRTSTASIENCMQAFDGVCYDCGDGRYNALVNDYCMQSGVGYQVSENGKKVSVFNSSFMKERGAVACTNDLQRTALSVCIPFCPPTTFPNRHSRCVKCSVQNCKYCSPTNPEECLEE